MTTILDIVGGRPVHVITVKGEVVSDAMPPVNSPAPVGRAGQGPPPSAPAGPMTLVFAQSGRSTDLMTIEAASRKFGQDADGQVWYSLVGFMNWDQYQPVDITQLNPTMERS